MRVLLLCGDYYHPGEIPAEGVVPLKEKGFEFDVIFDAKEFKQEMLRDYPVVILSKCDDTSKTDTASWKTPEVQQAFMDFVENGGGLLATHSATVAGESTGLLDALLGSKFTYHPSQTSVTVQPVKPHPINEGVEAFCETDEHYRLEFLADDIDIIAASYSPPQGEAAKQDGDPYNNNTAWVGAAAYARKQGKGKVAVLTPGHNLPVWHNPQFQKMLENALRWLGVKNLI